MAVLLVPSLRSPSKTFKLIVSALFRSQPRPRKWCLTTDLSFPPERSVNDGISPEVCHFHCKGIQSSVSKIMLYGKGALLAKSDLKEFTAHFLYVHQSIIYLE